MPENKTFGRPGVIYVLATSSKPLTASEVEDIAPCTLGTIQNLLRCLFEDGYVVRRRRYPHEKQRAPYEYTLAHTDCVSFLTTDMDR